MSAARKGELEIFCPKCGAWVWHEPQDAQWMRCQGCGDLHNLADPATQIGEIAAKGKPEKRV